MKKSARQLAKEYNVSDRVFNVILMQKGYQTGEPGNYEPTEKGLPYVEEHENTHGNGGYAHMNKSEIIRRWDDSIKNDLEITAQDIDAAYAFLAERGRQQRKKLKAESEASLA